MKILKFLLGLIIGVALTAQAFGQTYPGGFVEDQGVATRAPITNFNFVPNTRTAFTFPAPYSTRGYRLTINSDCASNQDCVEYIGYSYWPMMNNHVADSFMYIVIALRSTRGGAGLTLFRLDKVAGTVTKVGNLFPSALSSFQTSIFSEQWYFSFTQPYTLYIPDFVSLLRYNVQTQAMTTAFTILNRSYTTTTGQLVSFGCTSSSCPRRVAQLHSSADDTVHVGTLIQTQTGGADVDLGCLAYNATTDVFRFYPKVGTYDECSVDRTGRYTVVLEQTIPNDIANRIFDNTTGQLVTTKSGPSGTLGHMDMGYGYAIGTDNNGSVPNPTTFPNATVRYDFPAATPTTVIHFNPNSSTNIMQHPSHTNAVPIATRSVSNQYFCGSDNQPPREIMCARVDGVAPLKQLVVAPVMTNPSASGGSWNNGAYGLQPKGHLDVTGRYFLWTSNLGGNRLHAFLVEVPGHKLITFNDTVAPAAPTGVSVQ